MLVSVKPFQLLRLRHAESDRLFEDEEEQTHAGDRPCGDAEDAEHLHAELQTAARVEETRLRGEQSDCQRTPEPVRAVYRDRADGVVDMEHLIDQFHDDNDEDTRHKPDDRRAERVDRLTARRNGDKSRKRAVERHGDVGLFVPDPCKAHGRRRGDRSRDRRIGEDKRKFARGGCRRAVEAVPAEPQNEHAERAERERVPGNRAPW